MNTLNGGEKMILDGLFFGGIDNLYVTLVSVWLLISMIYYGIDTAKRKKNRIQANEKENAQSNKIDLSDDAHEIRFLNDVIAFTIGYMFIAAAILYHFTKKIYEYPNIVNDLALYFILGTTIIFYILIFVYFRKAKKHFVAILLILTFITLSFGTCLYFGANFYRLAIGSTLAYIIVSVIILIKMRVELKNKYGIGILYTIGSAVSLAGVTYIGYGRNVYIVATVKFILALIVALSFFIFYCETYLKNIYEKENQMVDRITELNAAYQKINYLGYVNQDTGVKNIKRFELDFNNRKTKITHLLMLNLDNYRVMYNSKGYTSTMEVMRTVAAELKKIVIANKGDMYHISNDKFILTLNTSNEECGKAVRNILNLFISNEFFAINLKPYIGFTGVTDSDRDYEEVLKRLEFASDTAIHSNEFYAEYNKKIMENRATKRIAMEIQLRKACEEQTWELFLQPKVFVETNIISGAEGLIRWKGAERKVSPAQFIPVAEEMGLIVDIGKTIIDKGFQYAKTIAEGLDKYFTLSVNLSAYQLMSKDFVRYVFEHVKRWQTNPRNIIFEITETSFIDNKDRVKMAIKDLRDIGFRFSLDDFGTGYSSIGYLSAFELDEVKFDRDFTSELNNENSKNFYILKTVAALGKDLNYKIVAEGIENKEQLDKINSIGVQIYQGYYFSKPVTFEEFVPMFKKNINENKEAFNREFEKRRLQEEEWLKKRAEKKALERKMNA